MPLMMQIVWTAFWALLFFPCMVLANLGERVLDIDGLTDVVSRAHEARTVPDPRELHVTYGPTTSPAPTLPPSQLPTPVTPFPTQLPTPIPSHTPTPAPTLPRPGGPGKGAAAQSLVYLQSSTSEKHLPSDANDLLQNKGRVSGVSECDDTPMYHVPLDFTFLYAGGRFQHIWLNPNGMVFFSPLPPCDAYFSAGTPCDFDSGALYTYYGAYITFIAAFGSDFNPAQSADATITWAQDESRIIIKWSNLSLYGSDWNNYDFSLELRASGLVRIHHQAVRFPKDVSDAPNWVINEGVLVALRFGELPYLNRTLVTAAQQAARSKWLSGDGSINNPWDSDGVYAPYDLIANYTVHDFCPFPTKLCASPLVYALPESSAANYTTTSGGDSENGTTMNLTLSGTDALGCDDDVMNFVCQLTLSVQENTNKNSLMGANITAPAFLLPASSGVGPSSGLVCSVPVEALVVGEYEVTLWYEAVTSSSSEGPLAPIGLTQVELHDVIIFSTTANDTSAAATVEGTCDACGASSGDNACLGCDETHPFSDYNCQGQCDFKQGMYYQDPYGKCCEAINGTNCLGRCGNLYLSQGLVSDGSYAVCCSNVDCAGYCSGKASIDSCGVCSGGKTNHEANSDIDCDGVCFGNATCAPTPMPSLHPSPVPTPAPTRVPFPVPSLAPSPSPSLSFPPSLAPTDAPTLHPTPMPSPLPTPPPSWLPTSSPSLSPSATRLPTLLPSSTHHPSGTHNPTLSPSSHPSPLPTMQPFPLPSPHPTLTLPPTSLPTLRPSHLPTLAPSQPSIAPTVMPLPLPTPLPTIKPSIHPTKQATAPTRRPTLRPTHYPTPQPSLRPTLSPLSVAYVTTAMVLDNVDTTTWSSEGTKCEQVLKGAIVNSIDVVTQSSQIDSVSVADYTARRRRKLISGDLVSLSIESRREEFSRSDHPRQLSSSLLATFELVVESDPDLTYVANASMVFKHVTSTFLASIDNGNFASAIATQATNKGSSVMSASSVNVAASQMAVADYSTYYEVLKHRYPTPYPTHSQAPSIHPTSHPAMNDADNDDKSSNKTSAAGWGDINPWLIVVIVLEVCISIALCVCCMKVGGANQQGAANRAAAADPLSLNALARQQLRDGVFDPTSLGMQQTRLREQYVATVRAIPCTKYKAPAVVEAAASPQPEEEGKNNACSSSSSSSSSSPEAKSDGNVSSQPSDPSSKCETASTKTTTVSRMAPGCYVEDSCSICLCPFEEDGDDNLVKVLNCGHGFHPPCLEAWLSRRNLCPLCKRVAVTHLDAALNNRENPVTAANGASNSAGGALLNRPMHRRLFTGGRQMFMGRGRNTNNENDDNGGGGGGSGGVSVAMEGESGPESGSRLRSRQRASQDSAIEMQARSSSSSTGAPSPSRQVRTRLGLNNSVTPEASPDGTPRSVDSGTTAESADPRGGHYSQRSHTNNASSRNRCVQQRSSDDFFDPLNVLPSRESSHRSSGSSNSSSSRASDALDEFRRRAAEDESGSASGTAGAGGRSYRRAPPRNAREGTASSRQSSEVLASLLVDMGFPAALASGAASQFDSADEAIGWCLAQIEDDNEDEDYGVAGDDGANDGASSSSSSSPPSSSSPSNTGRASSSSAEAPGALSPSNNRSSRPQLAPIQRPPAGRLPNQEGPAWAIREASL